MPKQLFKIITALALLGLASTACGAPATNPAPTTAAMATDSFPESVTLKIAVLPIIDTLPMYVAEQAGLFKAHGVSVEFLPVASAPERDQLLAAGQADGAVNETIAVMLFNQAATQMQVVRYALRPTAESGHFFILASAQSGIASPDGLKGVEIGVSQGTVIEYVTERLLQARGFASEEIKTIAVPKIPDRMALLASGKLKAGVLPDPLAALAVQQGAVSILDDAGYPEYGFSVISFRKETIEAYPEAIRAFLAAIEDATALVNQEPASYTSLLSDKQLVLPALLENYKVPSFPAAGVPSESEWLDALTWAKEKGMVDSDISYTDSVNPSLLP